MTKTLAPMLDDKNNKTYYNSFVLVIQHGGDDVNRPFATVGHVTDNF